MVVFWDFSLPAILVPKANACRNEAVYEVFNKNNENSIKVIQEKFVLNFKIFHTCKFSGSNIRKKH